MPNPVVYFEIVTHDAPAQIEFMRRAFDWPIDATPSASVDLPAYYRAMPGGDEAPSNGINGGIGETREGYGGHVTFYVGVENVGASLETIETLGGTRLMGPQDVPDGPTIGLFKDPQGHVIGLVGIGEHAK